MECKIRLVLCCSKWPGRRYHTLYYVHKIRKSKPPDYKLDIAVAHIWPIILLSLLTTFKVTFLPSSTDVII